MKGNEHQSVLLAESIAGLAIKPDGIYIDATFGRGGHSQAILNQLGDQGKLIAIDTDPQAVEFAYLKFSKDPRFVIKHCAFSQLHTIAREYNCLKKVDGILLDLGVSSPQLEKGDRGFSFSKEGPLDMRMNPKIGMNAANWLAKAKEKQIAEVLRNFGEERYAKRIARSIKSHEQPIQTTHQLVDIIKAAKPIWEKNKHPATRSFLAIRIFINNELGELEAILKACLNILAIGGRLLVISFHSLEDRIVKQFLHKHTHGDYYPKKLAIKHKQIKKQMRCIGKAIKPTLEEISMNPRARSAILRIGEKIL